MSVLTADEQKLLEEASYENSEVQVDPLIVLVYRLVSLVEAAEAAVKPGACGDNTSTHVADGGYPRCDLNQAAEVPPPETCIWTEDSDGRWDTACGEAFEFITGTPEENRLRFCAYCGKHLIAKPFVWEEFDDDE